MKGTCGCLNRRYQSKRPLLAECERKPAEFPNELKDSTYDLLNELALSYLEQFILKAFPLDGSMATIGGVLFPRWGQVLPLQQYNLDTELYYRFINAHKMDVPGFDATAVGTRIWNFLSHRASGTRASPGALGPKLAIQGITRVVAYLLADILRRSSDWAIGSERSDPCKYVEGGYIVPSMIRLVVYRDVHLRPLFRYSAVFWSGRVS